MKCVENLALSYKFPTCTKLSSLVFRTLSWQNTQLYDRLGFDYMRVNCFFLELAINRFAKLTHVYSIAQYGVDHCNNIEFTISFGLTSQKLNR